jgi:hypothetical protein
MLFDPLVLLLHSFQLGGPLGPDNAICRSRAKHRGGRPRSIAFRGEQNSLDRQQRGQALRQREAMPAAFAFRDGRLRFYRGRAVIHLPGQRVDQGEQRGAGKHLGSRRVGGWVAVPHWRGFHGLAPTNGFEFTG